nr:DUF5998 family protein [Pseudactinotalea sp. HY160]
MESLRSDIQRAGYYPDVVADILGVALDVEPVVSHLVHVETIFDRTEVRRHVTVLVLSPTRLIVAHVDDLPPEHPDEESMAAASTEAVALREIRSVGLTHGIADPANYISGQSPTELTLAIAWGAIERIDLEPATCADPDCDADHGYTGTSVPDDLVVRVSAAAEGDRAMTAAAEFARALSAATVKHA